MLKQVYSTVLNLPQRSFSFLDKRHSKATARSIVAATNKRRLKASRRHLHERLTRRWTTPLVKNYSYANGRDSRTKCHSALISFFLFLYRSILYFLFCFFVTWSFALQLVLAFLSFVCILLAMSNNGDEGWNSEDLNCRMADLSHLKINELSTVEQPNLQVTKMGNENWDNWYISKDECEHRQNFEWCGISNG